METFFVFSLRRLTSTHTHVDGHLWTQVDIIGRQRTSMDINGRQWSSMDVNGHECTQLDVNGRQRALMHLAKLFKIQRIADMAMFRMPPRNGGWGGGKHCHTQFIFPMRAVLCPFFESHE